VARGTALGREARPPAERTSFVGRRSELADVRRLLEGSRLVTLVGPGGVGKTRLAVRALQDLSRAFPDGRAFADLSPVRDSAMVVRRVAEALDLRDSTGGWLTDDVATLIGDRRLLLVVDNCEHVRDASAVLVDTLLGSCPGLRILATSRQPLDVPGEALLAVPPLASPAAGAAHDPLSYDAVRLLVDRARSAVPELDVDQLDAVALGELSRRLDGLPLAIELAAARLRTFGVGDVLTRLDDRFHLLARTSPAGPERQRTLRSTMEWSHGLLEPAAQLLWSRAAVFAGAFDAPAAEAVCADADLPAPAVLDALAQLVDASVLQVERASGGTSFRMLETVRAFGAELLSRSGDERRVRSRHRDWCAELAAAACRDFPSPRQVTAFDLLDRWHPDIGAALRFCLRDPGEVERGLALACDLWLYWEARGHVGEGRRLLQDLLEACGAPCTSRARGLVVAGFLSLQMPDADRAVRLLTAGLTAAEAQREPFVAAMATQYLGQAALFRGEFEQAQRLLRDAAGRFLPIDPRHAAFCSADVGVAALFAGSCDTAAAAFAESLALNQGGDPWTRSHALWGSGLVRLRAGDADACLEQEHEALVLIRGVDHGTGIGLCVEALAWARAARQEWDQAARLAGVAQAVWRSLPNVPPPPPLAALRREYLEPALHALGNRRWQGLIEEAGRLTREQAVAAALGEPPAAPPPGRSTPSTSVLTKRQQEVAALVARGMTDREIAASLVISPRTAESHVEQILTRLRLRSRAEIAAWTAATGGGASPPSVS
jgi:non-specific serine/threonine protein kinase